MRHIVIDTDSNTSRTQGKSGRRYSPDEVALAEQTPDDPASRAVLADIEQTAIDPAQLLHDCPECRAALARGEQPQTFGPEELAELMAVPPPRPRFARRPRWRAMKRRASEPER